MLHMTLFESATGPRRDGDEALVEVWRAHPESVLWVNWSGEPADEEVALLEEAFGLHSLGLHDALRSRHPPKIEAFGNHSFLLLRGLDTTPDANEFGTMQIAIFVGERFLVTRHSSPSSSIGGLRTRIEQDPTTLTDGPDRAAVTLCRIVVDRYAPLLTNVEVRIDELEDEMLTDPRDRHLRELVAIQGNLKKLKRVMVYHVQMFAALKKSAVPGFGDDVKHEVNDVYEHLERAMSFAGLYSEVSSDLMNGYLSLASHRLNHIMKVLTIVTAVFVPLGFLAGLYGMNFDYMPELKWRYAYFTLLSVMATVALALLWLFWRKGWLRPS